LGLARQSRDKGYMHAWRVAHNATRTKEHLDKVQDYDARRGVVQPDLSPDAGPQLTTKRPVIDGQAIVKHAETKQWPRCSDVDTRKS